MSFFERFRKPVSQQEIRGRDASVDEALRARDDAYVSYMGSLAETENLGLLREQEGLKIELELLLMKKSMTEEAQARAKEISARIREIDELITAARTEAEKRARTQISG